MIDKVSVENALNVYNMICETEDLISQGVEIQDLDYDAMQRTKIKAETLIKQAMFAGVKGD